MSTLVKQENTIPVVEGYSEDQIILIRDTICKGANPEELQLFINVAKKTQLDPFSKQIHAVKRWNKFLGREEMAIQIGIDGYRSIADRTGAYAGSSDPEFTFEGKSKLPISAKVTVQKIVQGTVCNFTSTVYWDEFFPGPKLGYMWQKMPRHMLSKVAEANALRKAFPGQFAGTYIPEEMERADAEVQEEVEARKVVTQTPDWGDRSEVIDSLKVLAGKATEGLSVNEKGQWMERTMGVQSFKDLSKKEVKELKEIAARIESEAAAS